MRTSEMSCITKGVCQNTTIAISPHLDLTSSNSVRDAQMRSRYNDNTLSLLVCDWLGTPSAILSFRTKCCSPKGPSVGGSDKRIQAEGSLGDTAFSPKNRFFLRQNPFFGLGLCRPMKEYQRINELGLNQTTRKEKILQSDKS